MKVYCFFLSSAHRKNWLSLLVHNVTFLRNFEFSKSVRYSLRKYFYSTSTRLLECHRVNLITQTTGISQKFTALLSSVHHKKILNLSVHNLSFLRNFEFAKCVPYSQSYNFFFLNHSLAYMPARELNYADNWNFAKIYCFFFYYRCIRNTGLIFKFTIEAF